MGYLLKGLRGILVLLCFTFLFRMLYTPGRCGRICLDIYHNKTGNMESSADDSKDSFDDHRVRLCFLTLQRRKNWQMVWRRLFRDWGRLGVPVHEMAVIVMIAFRFIPIMLEELNVLMDAQAARGARFEEGNVVEKCKGVMTLLFPLFLMTVRRSSDLAMAMEARGIYRKHRNFKNVSVDI